MFEFLVQVVSCLDSAVASPSPTPFPLSRPGFAKMPTTRLVRMPQSTPHCTFTLKWPGAHTRATHVHTHSHTHTHSPSDCWANAGQSLSGGSGLGLDIFKGGPTPIQKRSPSSLGSGWWHFLPLSPPLGAQMSSFLSPGPLLLDVFLLRSMGSAPPPHPAVLIPPHPTLAIYRRWVCTETGRQWPLSGHFLGCKQASFLRLLCVPTTLPPAPV